MFTHQSNVHEPLRDSPDAIAHRTMTKLANADAKREKTLHDKVVSARRMSGDGVGFLVHQAREEESTELAHKVMMQQEHAAKGHAAVLSGATHTAEELEGHIAEKKARVAQEEAFKAGTLDKQLQMEQRKAAKIHEEALQVKAAFAHADTIHAEAVAQRAVEADVARRSAVLEQSKAKVAGADERHTEALAKRQAHAHQMAGSGKGLQAKFNDAMDGVTQSLKNQEQQNEAAARHAAELDAKTASARADLARVSLVRQVSGEGQALQHDLLAHQLADQQAAADRRHRASLDAKVAKAEYLEGGLTF